MNTEQYRLRSNNERVVDIPSDYSKIAAEIVDLAKENPAELKGEKYASYISDPGILLTAARLAHLRRKDSNSPDIPKLEDSLYLRVCVYEIGKTHWTVRFNGLRRKENEF